MLYSEALTQINHLACASSQCLAWNSNSASRNPIGHALKTYNSTITNSSQILHDTNFTTTLIQMTPIPFSYESTIPIDPTNATAFFQALESVQSKAADELNTTLTFDTVSRVLGIDDAGHGFNATSRPTYLIVETTHNSTDGTSSTSTQSHAASTSTRSSAHSNKGTSSDVISSVTSQMKSSISKDAGTKGAFSNENTTSAPSSKTTSMETAHEVPIHETKAHPVSHSSTSSPTTPKHSSTHTQSGTTSFSPEVATSSSATSRTSPARITRSTPLHTAIITTKSSAAISPSFTPTDLPVRHGKATVASKSSNFSAVMGHGNPTTRNYNSSMFGTGKASGFAHLGATAAATGAHLPAIQFAMMDFNSTNAASVSTAPPGNVTSKTWIWKVHPGANYPAFALPKSITESRSNSTAQMLSDIPAFRDEKNNATLHSLNNTVPWQNSTMQANSTLLGERLGTNMTPTDPDTEHARAICLNPDYELEDDPDCAVLLSNQTMTLADLLKAANPPFDYIAYTKNLTNANSTLEELNIPDIDYFALNKENLERSQAREWYSGWTVEKQNTPEWTKYKEWGLFWREFLDEPNFECPQGLASCSLAIPSMEEIRRMYPHNRPLARRVLFIVHHYKLMHEYTNAIDKRFTVVWGQVEPMVKEITETFTLQVDTDKEAMCTMITTIVHQVIQALVVIAIDVISEGVFGPLLTESSNELTSSVSRFVKMQRAAMVQEKAFMVSEEKKWFKKLASLAAPEVENLGKTSKSLSHLGPGTAFSSSKSYIEKSLQASRKATTNYLQTEIGDVPKLNEMLRKSGKAPYFGALSPEAKTQLDSHISNRISYGKHLSPWARKDQHGKWPNELLEDLRVVGPLSSMPEMVQKELLESMQKHGITGTGDPGDMQQLTRENFYHLFYLEMPERRARIKWTFDNKVKPHFDPNLRVKMDSAEEKQLKKFKQAEKEWQEKYGTKWDEWNKKRNSGHQEPWTGPDKPVPSGSYRTLSLFDKTELAESYEKYYEKAGVYPYDSHIKNKPRYEHPALKDWLDIWNRGIRGDKDEKWFKEHQVYDRYWRNYPYLKKGFQGWSAAVQGVIKSMPSQALAWGVGGVNINNDITNVRYGTPGVPAADWGAALKNDAFDMWPKSQLHEYFQQGQDGLGRNDPNAENPLDAGYGDGGMCGEWEGDFKSTNEVNIHILQKRLANSLDSGRTQVYRMFKALYDGAVPEPGEPSMVARWMLTRDWVGSETKGTVQYDLSHLEEFNKDFKISFITELGSSIMASSYNYVKCSHRDDAAEKCGKDGYWYDALFCPEPETDPSLVCQAGKWYFSKTAPHELQNVALQSIAGFGKSIGIPFSAREMLQDVWNNYKKYGNNFRAAQFGVDSMESNGLQGRRGFHLPVCLHEGQNFSPFEFQRPWWHNWDFPAICGDHSGSETEGFMKGLGLGPGSQLHHQADSTFTDRIGQVIWTKDPYTIYAVNCRMGLRWPNHGESPKIQTSKDQPAHCGEKGYVDCPEDTKYGDRDCDLVLEGSKNMDRIEANLWFCANGPGHTIWERERGHVQMDIPLTIWWNYKYHCHKWLEAYGHRGEKYMEKALNATLSEFRIPGVPTKEDLELWGIGSNDTLAIAENATMIAPSADLSSVGGPGSVDDLADALPE